MRLILFALTALFLCGCDPAVYAARVRPDKSIEIQPNQDRKPLKADVYSSADKAVELQVYGSGGMIGAPQVAAFLVNKRSVPLQVDLMQTYQKVSWRKETIKPRRAEFEGCTRESDKHACDSSRFELAPGSQKQVKWVFSSPEFGELIVPFESSVKGDNEIRVLFKHCGAFSSKCETESKANE